MLNNLIILFCVVGLGCAKQHSYYIDPDFAEYVRNFERDFGLPVQINIRYVDEFDVVSRVGLCIQRPNSTNEILILKGFWQRSTTWNRQQLMYHELAHCVAYLPHNDTIENGRKISIMSSTIIDAKVFEENYDKYINELKNAIAAKVSPK